MVDTILLAFELLSGCWHCNLSRPFELSGARMKFVLAAERSSLTIALTRGASSSHNEKLLVAARSTSLIDFCPLCAVSLAGTLRNPTAIARQPDRCRDDSR